MDTNWRWLVFLILWAAWIPPLYRLLGKAGFARGWAFIAFPPVGVIILWYLAFVRWRTEETGGARP